MLRGSPGSQDRDPGHLGFVVGLHSEIRDTRHERLKLGSWFPTLAKLGWGAPVGEERAHCERSGRAPGPRMRRRSPGSQKRDPSTSSGQAPGHPRFVVGLHAEMRAVRLLQPRGGGLVIWQRSGGEVGTARESFGSSVCGDSEPLLSRSRRGGGVAGAGVRIYGAAAHRQSPHPDARRGGLLEHFRNSRRLFGIGERWRFLGENAT
jgi:hypothetical protein